MSSLVLSSENTLIVHFMNIVGYYCCYPPESPWKHTHTCTHKHLSSKKIYWGVFCDPEHPDVFLIWRLISYSSCTLFKLLSSLHQYVSAYKSYIRHQEDHHNALSKSSLSLQFLEHSSRILFLSVPWSVTTNGINNIIFIISLLAFTLLSYHSPYICVNEATQNPDLRLLSHSWDAGMMLELDRMDMSLSLSL